MRFVYLVLAAFVGSLLAIVFVLAWRASTETGKSIPASLTDVPSEAQKLASSVRSKATDVVNKKWGSVSEEDSSLASTVEESLQSGEEALGI